MLNKKDFVSRNLYGDNIDKNVYRYGYDLIHAKKGLTPTGKNVVEKFILQNKFKSNMMKLREEEYIKLSILNYQKEKVLIIEMLTVLI